MTGIVGTGGGGDSLACIMTKIYDRKQYDNNKYQILVSSESIESIKNNLDKNYTNQEIKLDKDCDSNSLYLKKKNKICDNLRIGYCKRKDIADISYRNKLELYSREGLSQKEIEEYFEELEINTSDDPNIDKEEYHYIKNIFSIKGSINKYLIDRFIDKIAIKRCTSDGNLIEKEKRSIVLRSPLYGSWIEEALLCNELNSVIHMIYAPGDNKKANYLGDYPDNLYWTSLDIEDQMDITKKALKVFIEKYKINKWILVDVGGDIINDILDLSLAKRDELMLYIFKSLLKEKIINEFEVIIYGPGVDGHDLPSNVENKLLKLKYLENVELSKNFAENFDNFGADTQKNNSRANKIFKLALDDNKESFLENFNIRGYSYKKNIDLSILNNEISIARKTYTKIYSSNNM